MFASVQDSLACLGSGTYVSSWLWCTWVRFRLRQHVFVFICVAIYIFNCTAVAPILACARVCVFVSSCLCVYACLNEWVSLCVCVCTVYVYTPYYVYTCMCGCIYMHSVGAGGRLFEPNQAVARWARRAEDVPSATAGVLVPEQELEKWLQDQLGLPWHCGDIMGRVVLVMVEPVIWSDRDDLLKILVWSSDPWSWSDHCHGTWRASRRLRTTRWGSRRWNDPHFDCNYSDLLTNYIFHCLRLYCICIDLNLYLYRKQDEAPAGGTIIILILPLTSAYNYSAKQNLTLCVIFFFLYSFHHGH